MKRCGLLCFIPALVVLLIVQAGAANNGITGCVYERNADGGIGPTVLNAQITFISTATGLVKTVITNNGGRYLIQLTPGSYWARVSHASYEDYSSVPGTVVFKGGGLQTANFFLNKPRVTTILLLRHAEKAANPPDNPPLTPQGDQRAQLLAKVAWNAGVSGIYSTDLIRTKDTVKYLAQKLHLPTTLYNASQEVVDKVFADHRGDVVMIAGHGNTVSDIAKTFGANLNDMNEISDFDNLYVITRSGNLVGKGNTSVVNLQYGVDSIPDITKGAYPIKTVLLLRNAETVLGPDPSLSAAGRSRAQELVHVMKKAGIGAIYKTSSKKASETVQPLADALGLAPANYDPAKLKWLIDQIKAQKTKVILVVADSDKMSDLIKLFKGYPLPPVLRSDYDNIFFITLFAAGDANVLSLQYGEINP